MENLNVSESSNRFRKISIFASLGLVLLLPIFFIPSDSISLHAAKISLLTVGFVLLLVMFLSSIFLLQYFLDLSLVLSRGLSLKFILRGYYSCLSVFPF